MERFAIVSVDSTYGPRKPSAGWRTALCGISSLRSDRAHTAAATLASPFQSAMDSRPESRVLAD